VEKDRDLNRHPKNCDDDRDCEHRLRDGFTPVVSPSVDRPSHDGHPRFSELALLRTFDVMVAPTAMASAINAAAITTVVALTSPRSKSF
jgi:hypothetical protein